MFPVSLLAIIIPLGIIMIIVSAVTKNVVKKHVQEKKGKVPLVVRFLLAGVKDAILRLTNFLVYEFEHTKEKERDNTYLLYGVQVHRFVIDYLFIVNITILCIAVLSFWNTFFAEADVHQCFHFRDCFLIHPGNLTPVKSPYPIKDCELYHSTEDATIICFEQAYKYSEGLGEAGGFLFIMQVVINIFIHTTTKIVKSILKAYKIQQKEKSNKLEKTASEANVKQTSEQNKHSISKVSCCAKIAAGTIVLTIYALVFVLIPIIFVLNQDFLETLGTPIRLFQFVLYLCTSIILLLVPPIVAAGGPVNTHVRLHSWEKGCGVIGTPTGTRRVNTTRD